MEIWILLAVAGSGYLAHCWQSLQKSKEASSGKSDDDHDDDDDHSGSSSRTHSSRRKYCHFSSSRRPKGRSTKNLHVSKFNDSVGKMIIGHATNAVSDDEGRDENEAQAPQSALILDSHRCPKSSMQSPTGLDVVGSYPMNTKNGTISPLRCPCLHTFNSYGVPSLCGFDFSHQICKGGGLMSVESLLGSWDFAHHTRDSATLVYDVLDTDVASGEKAFLDDETWMQGFWSAYEDTSVSGTNTSFALQEQEGRNSINTRKVRSHQKNGSTRSRDPENYLTVTSSESSLPVQFGYACSQEETDDSTHFSSACEQPFHGLGKHFRYELAGAIVSDCLPSEEASQRSESFKVLSKTGKPQHLVVKKAMDSPYLPCLPLQSSRKGQVNASRQCSASQRGDRLLLQGTANSLLKAILFNFGVGVGMMFASLSNNCTTTQSIRLHEETLCSLKDLEGEVHCIIKLMVKGYQNMDNREYAMAEQINALFKIVSRIFDVVERVRNSLSQDLACMSSMDFKHSEERAKLEAELEAELERMEINMTAGDASDVSKDDLNIGHLVQGELFARDLPCDAELSTAGNNGVDSCSEVSHCGGFGVPPMELAKRLREVLEARQEREILELEAKVKHLDGKLRAKQEELQTWKQRALHLLQGCMCESFSSFEGKDVCVGAVERTEKVLRADKPYAGMYQPTSDCLAPLCWNEHTLCNCTKEICPSHLRMPQSTSCMDGADNEFPEEISQLLSDTFTESPGSLPCGLFTDAHAKDGGKRGMPMGHQELESTHFSDDVPDNTPDNTPCMVTTVDKHAMLHCLLENKLEQNIGMEASSREEHSNLDWFGELVPIPKSVSVIQDKPVVCLQGVVEISESYAQFRHTLDWSTSDDGSYSSDMDEELGQLLIKCIVQKGKRGSLIVELAQSVMASFDNEEISSTTELPGVA